MWTLPHRFLLINKKTGKRPFKKKGVSTIFTILYSNSENENLKPELKWIGWQHYWKGRSKKKIVEINDAIPKYLIYLILPDKLRQLQKQKCQEDLKNIAYLKLF